MRFCKGIRTPDVRWSHNSLYRLSDSTGAIMWEMEALRVVVDTNVMVSALRSPDGRNRQVLRACFEGRLRPVMGQSLFLEYEDVMGREALFRETPLAAPE